MTLDLSKIKSDAEKIAANSDLLLMALPVKDVLGMLAEIKSLNEQNGNLLECRSSVNAAVALENEALRKDAERYRWLRDHGCPSMESWFYELRAGEITKDQADSEIDKAMDKERP